MKFKLIMLLAILLMSFGVLQAADSVAVWIYDVDGDSLLDPATDTIYTTLPGGAPHQYQMWVGLESDVDLGGMSLGFRISSVDGVTWSYDTQVDGWGPLGINTGLAAVTVAPGSRLDPPSSAFDMTQLLITEKDVDGMLDDTIVFGGVSMMQVLELGAMEPMIRLHFTAGGVSGTEVKNICFDSAFVPPAGNWVYSNTLGGTFPPAIGPAICFPVAVEPLNDIDGTKPEHYAFDLGQNYPNPFNPVTTISFSVERKTNVNLSIFNILGQKVFTMVDGELEAGAYELPWEGLDDHGDQVASGIYFYKMYTDDFVETRKMVLMR